MWVSSLIVWWHKGEEASSRYGELRLGELQSITARHNAQVANECAQGRGENRMSATKCMRRNKELTSISASPLRIHLTKHTRRRHGLESEMVNTGRWEGE